MGKVFDVVIERDSKTRQFYASVPALPGCYSHSDTIEGLMENIKEAIELHVEVMQAKKLAYEIGDVLGMVKVTV